MSKIEYTPFYGLDSKASPSDIRGGASPCALAPRPHLCSSASHVENQILRRL